MRVAVIAGGLVLLVALAASPARADEESPLAPAQIHLTEGNRHFNLAEYDLAIAEYKEAYRLSDKPGLLFNIAQAYRLSGDCPMALRFYENYRRLAPQAENVADV